MICFFFFFFCDQALSVSLAEGVSLTALPIFFNSAVLPWGRASHSDRTLGNLGDGDGPVAYHQQPTWASAPPTESCCPRSTSGPGPAPLESFGSTRNFPPPNLRSLRGNRRWVPLPGISPPSFAGRGIHRPKLLPCSPAMHVGIIIYARRTKLEM